MNDALIIRVDANQKTGIGHVMRCLALAQGWKIRCPDIKIKFIGRIENSYIKDRIVSEGCELIDFNDRNASEKRNDIDAIVKVLKVNQSSQANRWIVLDGYHFTSDYQKALKEAGFFVLVIDDEAHLPEYHADILLNQNIHAEELAYYTDPKTVFLLGPKYVLLRKEFLDASKVRRTVPIRANNILISCGGVDSKNITEKTIDALMKLEQSDFFINIVIGSENPHVEKLVQKLGSAPFEYEILSNVKNMSFYLQQADLAITAGGSTCWETIYLGVPAINMILSRNQEKLAVHLDKVGALRCLGWWNEVQEERLADEIAEHIDNHDLRKLRIDSGFKLIDGYGVYRVCETAKLLSGKIENRDFITRHATIADSEQLFRLANDPTTRSFSFNLDPISMADHMKWYDGIIRSPMETAIWVHEYEGLIVAQVRYDKMAGNTAADVDVSVHPALRGRGLGTTIISNTYQSACKQLRVDSIRGIVFEDNHPSRRCFLKVGFHDKDIIMMKGKRCHLFELNPNET